MIGFFNILSCILVYYMYNKTSTLQQRVELLEYEMSNLGRIMYYPSAPELPLLKDKVRYC